MVMILKSYCLAEGLSIWEYKTFNAAHSALLLYSKNHFFSELMERCFAAFRQYIVYLQGAVVDSEVALQSSSIFSVCFSKYGWKVVAV